MATDFDAWRDAYDAARAELARLIDNPDKSVTVTEYQAQIHAARLLVEDAHEAMMRAAWTLR